MGTIENYETTCKFHANGFIEFIITLYRGTLYQWK